MSTPPPSNHRALPGSGATAPARIAFLLPAHTDELIYGAEARRAAAILGPVLNAQPLADPAGLAAAPPAWLAETEIAFTSWHSPRLDAALLARMPRLRAVFHGGGTVRPYISEAFWARGIHLSTAAAANAIPVAEFTLATILLSLKQAWQLSRQVNRERAFPARMPAVPGARGATVGLVSLGLIGRLVREYLRPFDVRVVAFDPYVAAAEFRELVVESVPLAELMARSDVVSLHTPLNPETRHLIGRALLDRLKPGATLINTARGGVVHEGQLVDFLRARPDVQAILDVTDPEPPAADSPLHILPNVFLTPHIAGSLGPECRRLGRAMLEECGRYLRREPLQYALTHAQAERQT